MTKQQNVGMKTKVRKIYKYTKFKKTIYDKNVGNNHYLAVNDVGSVKSDPSLSVCNTANCCRVVSLSPMTRCNTLIDKLSFTVMSYCRWMADTVNWWRPGDFMWYTAWLLFPMLKKYTAILTVYGKTGAFEKLMAPVPILPTFASEKHFAYIKSMSRCWHTQ